MGEIKVLLHGALGKMGQEVLGAVGSAPELVAVVAVDTKAQTPEIPLANGSGSIPLSSDLESAIIRFTPDVMVDFTNAEAAMPAIRLAVKHGVRLVTGTTGLSTADHDEIRRLCRDKQVGAVVAANFSLAATVMMHLAKTAAPFFDYAEIIELHHEQKADAPSGTAITTARMMVESRGEPFTYVPCSKETIANSRGGELDGIAMHSVRLPGQLAHQEIILGAPGQTLRIRLDQISREAFMPCVIMAVRKTMEIKEAVFGLESLLGL